MELIIVRHGRPVRIEGADGIADPELAPIGLEQAKAVADYLEQTEIDLKIGSLRNSLKYRARWALKGPP